VPVDPDLRERWLLARPAAWCAHREYSASYRWTRAYTAQELSEWADRRFSIGALRDIRVKSMTREGWVTDVEFVGDRATKAVKKDAIRAAFNMIRSNQFTLEHLPAAGGTPEEYIIYGAGWGHGVGMCQDGAFGLAQHGTGYRKILEHYFPAARLSNLYP
jgi:SpoIID/LytB domain protein